VHKFTVDYASVAAVMGCTPRACEERLKKLRKQAGITTAAAGSPVKKQQQQQAAGVSSSSSAAAAAATGGHDHARDDGDTPPTATVKKRQGRTEFSMARTREGVEIPLGVLLEVSPMPVNGWFEEEIFDEDESGGGGVWGE